MLKRILAAAGAVALTATLAVPASAAPSESFQLSCDNGFSGPVRAAGDGSNGQGKWTPAMSADHMVFIPIAFGTFTATAYEPGTQNVIVSFSDDTVVAKQAPQNGRDVTQCTFSSAMYGVYDEELGQVVDVTITGEVTATVAK
jgi:hypothetical protein